MQPKLSIVTISYNQAHFVRETLESVLDQLTDEMEYIVIDGGSTDGSPDIIAEYADRLAYTVSEPDSGPAQALNKGLAAATGEYFYYLNSDDLLLPQALQKMLRYTRQHPAADVLYGHGVMQFDHDDSREKIYSDRWDLRLYQSRVISIIQQGTLIRTEALRSVGGFNEKNRLNWDGEVLVDLDLAGASFRRVDDFFGVFRMYPGSITNTLSGPAAAKASSNRQRIAERITAKRGYEPFGPAAARLRKWLTDPLTMLRKVGVKGRIDRKLSEL